MELHWQLTYSLYAKFLPRVFTYLQLIFFQISKNQRSTIKLSFKICDQVLPVYVRLKVYT